MSDRAHNKPSFFTRKSIVLFLVLTNVFTVFLLLNIRYNISKVKKKRQQQMSAADTLKYDQNPAYIEQTQLFDLYETKHVNIVMMGSSFTQRVHWNELLSRHDVANRGVGSDVSEGYLHRVKNVALLQPRICFLEIGANDIIKDVPIDTIVQNTLTLIYLLSSAKVETVLTKCFFATAQFPGYEVFNLKADSLNVRFDKLKNEFGSDLMIIDINPQISSGNIRNREYALSDGVHLNAKAYLIWKKEIEKMLTQKDIVSK